MVNIDINCDMGESFGAYRKGQDEEILAYITSANIACGFHAGDFSTMQKTVKMSLDKGVGIGAHPGLTDLMGFGRRHLEITPSEAYELVIYQIGALNAFIKAEGGEMQHVKPHGALYNMAAKRQDIAEAIAEAVYKVNSELVLFGLAGGEMVKAGEKAGLRTASEVFSDRTYQQDGTLTSRQEPDALITDYEQAVSQVIRMVKENKVQSIQNKDIAVQADTVCIHGDGDYALDFARYINKGLKEAGIGVTKVKDVLA